MNITLLGNPISTNSLYRSHCRFGYPTVYMTANGAALKESYQWQARSSWKSSMIEDEVHLNIKLFFGKKNKVDIDNFHKICLDSLTGIVWKDDSQIVKMTVIKGYDKKNPRIEIEIL